MGILGVNGGGQTGDTCRNLAANKFQAEGTNTPVPIIRLTDNQANFGIGLVEFETDVAYRLIACEYGKVTE